MRMGGTFLGSGRGISIFKLEVELPKHIKSEVIWGHSSEHVQKAVEYMGLESKKEVGTYFILLLCNRPPKAQ